VTKVAGKNQERIARRQVDKFAERRAQLAASALQTLSELGYARTSLRDIAQNSEFSHGVLHYYFNDKVDLIIESVKQYKPWSSSVASAPPWPAPCTTTLQCTDCGTTCGIKACSKSHSAPMCSRLIRASSE